MLFDLSARVFSSSSRCCDIRWGPLFRLRVEAPRDQRLNARHGLLRRQKGFQPIVIIIPSVYPLPQGSRRRLGKIAEVDQHVTVWRASEILSPNAVGFR